MKDEINRKNFESIQNSLFVLCLDGEAKNKNNDIDVRSIACGDVLHGNKEFTSNRWFDKTIQVNLWLKLLIYFQIFYNFIIKSSKRL